MWPKEVRAERRTLTGGGVAYTLYHAAVGELGQILLQPLSTGGCQMTCEVLDRPDGLKEERTKLLKPLEEQLLSALSPPLPVKRSK